MPTGPYRRVLLHWQNWTKSGVAWPATAGVRPEAVGMWWLVVLLGRLAARRTAGGVASWFMCLDAVVVATN